jgi:hypothetical protein
MRRFAVSAAALALSATAAAAQDAPATVPESGVIGSGAPNDVFLEVTTGEGGAPVLSQEEFPLALGGYYRFNFACPDARDDATGFHLEVTDLLANAHLRVVSVNDIEIYMQGITFRAIECDEAGAARFSFHPMRRGVYEIYVRDHSDPAQEAFGRFVVE